MFIAAARPVVDEIFKRLVDSAGNDKFSRLKIWEYVLLRFR
jgi:hypothetical protein